MKEKAKNVQQAIQIEAYLLSEKSGHPSGMESYFWSQAEGIVHARASAVAVAVKAVAVRKKAPAKAKATVASKTTPKPAAKATPKPAAKPKTAAKR